MKLKPGIILVLLLMAGLRAHALPLVTNCATRLYANVTDPIKLALAPGGNLVAGASTAGNAFTMRLNQLLAPRALRCVMARTSGTWARPFTATVLRGRRTNGTIDSLIRTNAIGAAVPGGVNNVMAGSTATAHYAMDCPSLPAAARLPSSSIRRPEIASGT